MPSIRLFPSWHNFLWLLACFSPRRATSSIPNEFSLSLRFIWAHASCVFVLVLLVSSAADDGWENQCCFVGWSVSLWDSTKKGSSNSSSWILSRGSIIFSWFIYQVRGFFGSRLSWTFWLWSGFKIFFIFLLCASSIKWLILLII